MPRGGIGLGIADNSKVLVVQYLVEGGSAAESNFFSIGDEIVAVDRSLAFKDCLLSESEIPDPDLMCRVCR